MGRLSGGRRSGDEINKRLARYVSETGAGIDASPVCGAADRLDVWRLSGMAEASASVDRSLRYLSYRLEGRNEWTLSAGRSCLGNEERQRLNLEASDKLIEAAVAADPRLARRSRWHRGEEGEIACPAALAAGDDAPFFYRRRDCVSESAGGPPLRVVISTDDNKVQPGTAAAFVAVARLVQQWRSIEVWWQGAWLGKDMATGWVFHVPLVQGDMDFSRLDYCIADNTRDTLSYRIMMARACEVTKRWWNGCILQADRSYLEGTDIFVPHRGIEPAGESVAKHAAYWLGWVDLRWTNHELERAASSATQHWAPAQPEVAKPTKEGKRRMREALKEYQRQRDEERRRAAAERAAGLARNF